MKNWVLIITVIIPKQNNDNQEKLADFLETIDNPRVIQVDTSFQFDNAQYKVSAVCYLNPTTNKSEIASLSFISEESKENLKFVFSNFKSMSLHDPTVIIVDKDFNEITVLKSVLCIATILLCTFHIIKFF